ncbi:MAG: YitT family protein [Bacteroidetes bacterium]|nr:YitT family protein [Bacteroidota bacterium]
MNPFMHQVIVQTVLRHKKKPETPSADYSSFRMAKGFRELRILTRRLLKDIILISLGIGCAAFGLESFLLPNQFIDGGVTGISLLAAEVTRLPLFILLPVINIPFVLLAYHVISRQFAIRTAIAITGLVVCIAFVHFPEVTHDRLLVAVFGGFFLGAGIGLCMRGGAVIDGTEVLAIFLSRKFSLTVGDVIIAVNVLIFSIAAWVLSVEAALYSMITYLVASKMLDFIIEGIEEYIGVTIISGQSQQISEMIKSQLGRGLTVYRGKRGYGRHGDTRDADIIYIVITRLELHRLQTEIEKIDADAFVVMSPVKDTKGGMIKKRPLAQ